MLEIDHCDQITDQAATKLVKLSKYFKHIFLVYSIDFTSFDKDIYTFSIEKYIMVLISILSTYQRLIVNRYKLCLIKKSYYSNNNNFNFGKE